MKHVLAGSLLVLACAGCKTDPGADPLKAWEALHAAVAADDWKAALNLVTAATREKELAGTAFLSTLPPKSLPPSLASKAKPSETEPWSAERIAGETLLLDLKFRMRVPVSEAPVVESVTGDRALLVVAAPGISVRWAMAREGGEWKFDVAGTTSTTRAPGDGPPTPAECRARLKQLGVCMSLYESKYKTYPAGWDDMKRTGIITDERQTKCACGTAPGYEYFRPPGDEAPADLIVGWDAVPHADGTRNVLFFQGRVDALKEDVFQQRLKSQFHK